MIRRSKQYRILVTGSRSWTDEIRMRKAFARAYKDLGKPDLDQIVIVHGACPKGADRLATKIAKDLGLEVEKHPAKWEGGKGAGYARNQEMVDLGADYCLAFIRKCLGNACTRLDEHGTHGAVHCSTQARKAGIKTRIYKEGY